MPEFTALEWVPLGPRGRLALIGPRDDFPDPSVLLGRQVLIDGAEYRVAGFETYGVAGFGQPWAYPFSLLVKD